QDYAESSQITLQGKIVILFRSA
ncbi:hypothetical protein MNBD_GAMMA13-957, partial [hydrothermal vent metagenome]